MSLRQLAASVRDGTYSPREIVEAYLHAIASNDHLNAYLYVRAQEAMEEAESLETARSRGPLWGIPIAIKDIIDVAGTPMTGASKLLESNVSTTDAHVVERLKAAGAIIIGKVNTHEFAYGATTTSAHFGPAHNPWASNHICGGSSGGSGSAVAAGLAPGALGTDTAGSVRVPAALCGVTGLRPTMGRVSNRGVIPVAWSFDTVGPIATTAEDCALMMNVIAGHDPQDPSTSDVPVPNYFDGISHGLRDLRIGMVRTLFEEGVDPRVSKAVSSAVSDLKTLGAQVTDVEIPHFESFGVIQQSMQFPQATSVHLENLRTRLGDYGADVRARLLVGLFVPSTTYVTGQRARRIATTVIERVFQDVDLLVAPTMPVVAPPIGQEWVELDGKKMPYRLSLIRFNSCWSLVGLPVVSVPCGQVDNLPVGLALVGRKFDEATVLRAAHAYQMLTNWHQQTPKDLPRLPSELDVNRGPI